MADGYVYAPSVTALNLLLNAVLTKGRPNNVTDAYLKQNGLPTDNSGGLAANAKRARRVILHMGLIDDEHASTELWTSVRSDRKTALLNGLKNLYPDENNALSSYEGATDDELFDFFKGGSDLGDATVGMCVSTFKAIRNAAIVGVEEVKAKTAAAKAKPEKAAKAKPTPSSKPDDKPTDAKQKNVEVASAPGPEVIVNIQLQVPADPTGEVYDKFFASMKKYLYPNG